MAFVDLRRCFAETVPHLVAHVLGHGACLAPFLVEGLELLECENHVFFGCESLGIGDDLLFVGEVFLEIVVAEFLVDLPLVIELLDGCLLAFPYIGRGGFGNLSYCLEFGHQLLYARVEASYVVGVGSNLFNFGNDGFLALEVAEHFGFEE